MPPGFPRAAEKPQKSTLIPGARRSPLYWPAEFTVNSREKAQRFAKRISLRKADSAPAPNCFCCSGKVEPARRRATNRRVVMPNSTPQTLTTMEAGFTVNPADAEEFWRHQERMGPIAAAAPGFLGVIGGPIARSPWLYFCGKWQTPELMNQ